MSFEQGNVTTLTEERSDTPKSARSGLDCDC